MPIQDSKTPVIAQQIAALHHMPIRRLLVVGCGSGEEAAILGRDLRCDVTGIDLDGRFDTQAAKLVRLEVGDATALRFGNGSFDFVYSYHALEHIPNHRAALSEMSRVLCEQGGYCIGTPNRSRLVGYLGSKDATFGQKIEWNLIDWRAKVTGRFRNEYGAHAGFTKKELQSDLVASFGQAIDVTLEYYQGVYRRRQSLVKMLHASGLGHLFFPSIYFIGSKRSIGAG